MRPPELASPPRRVAVPPGFSLNQSCGPVAWGGGRWPNVDWIGGELWWVGREDGHAVWRRVRLARSGALDVAGTAAPELDAAWLAAHFGPDRPCPLFADAVVTALRVTYPGLRAFCHGSVFDGLITSIVGQSISVASAAVTQRRLCALFATPLGLAGRSFWPFPTADQLAAAEPALVRRCGVTGRRAEAIVAAARAHLADPLPAAAAARLDPVATRTALRALPLVGPWTAESSLLWGAAVPDAHPSGDVALLRAARRAYARPDLTLKSLDILAEGWRPNRAWAARLLWTDLLGPATES